MNSRENVAASIRFRGPRWLPHDFPEPFGSDFEWVCMNPSPDARPRSGTDEWGAVWENIGIGQLGQVKDFPLKDWKDLDALKIPDAGDPKRWESVKGARDRTPDKFIIGHGISIYARVHYLRGLENTWADICENPAMLGRLLDILVEMNLVAIEKYAAEGVDAFMFPDDWGLQDRLMIAPASWRAIWKPRYARIFAAAHAAGMFSFLHSCGYIVDILDDLIEIGLDAIHMDQQENMGLETLGRRFGGRLTFFSPVDIQTAMHRPAADIRAYCRQMAALLGRPAGGFIPRWYTDPAAAGHSQEAINVMCEEFLRISGEMYPRQQ
jgi:uroporphyrinogen decarboxylase